MFIYINMKIDTFKIIIILFVFYFLYNSNFKIENFFNIKKKIPKVIISTYFDKKKIPDKVFLNIKKYAPNYKYQIFDDQEINTFLTNNYDQNIVDTFNILKGAHKADLFRYCYLYKFGGIYIDIKSELIKNLNKVFNQKNIQLYTVLSGGKYKKTIYQGIIASIPNNPFFLKLINFMVSVKKPVKFYQIFTTDFYKNLELEYLEKKSDKLKNGLFKGKQNLYLFYEKCSTKACDCYDGLDRYNRCCYIYNNNEKIIKTRYSDYPW
jgi:hypothetical protein